MKHEGTGADVGTATDATAAHGAQQAQQAQHQDHPQDDQPDAQHDVGTNREALVQPGFLRLALAWIVSNFGDSALFITSAIWVKQLTGSDAAAGLVFAALGLPALFAPLTGQLADHFPRKMLLVVNNALAGAIVLLLLLVQDTGMLWLIYVVIFLYANTSYITVAAQSGLIRAMLPTRLLAPANGMLSSIDQGLRIVSPLAGAGLFALWGMDSVVVLTAVCFGATALILLTLKVNEPDAEPDPDGTFWLRTTAGFRFIATHRLLRNGTLTVFMCIAATGVLNVTNFSAIEDGIGMPVEFMSVLVSVQGVMSVVGGLTASGVIRRFSLTATMTAGVLLLGAGISMLATNSIALFLIGISLGGLGIPWMIVAYVTLRQTVTPMRLQGRAAAAGNLAFNVPQVMTSVLAAAIVGFIDYRVLVLATAAACVLSMVPVFSQRKAVPAP
ncbi:MFS transporter [Arthrobacter castelli]|uniref:MFS transporter n=1 Tax=Arthrobacter castelli TaxID=271431 RepID=UPI0003FD8277|nr:MFS transporter [Arthrobacter castelli]